MRTTITLLLLTLCACTAQQVPTSKPEAAAHISELSLEQMSAQPQVTCEANSDTRREVRVRHIAVEAFPRDTALVKAATPEEFRSAYQKLQLARADLIKGDSFETVWSRYSDPQTSGGNPDGDIGYFKRGELVPEFERVAFCLPTGEISPVFRTVFGFHVVQVTDVRY